MEDFDDGEDSDDDEDDVATMAIQTCDRMDDQRSYLDHIFVEL